MGRTNTDPKVKIEINEPLLGTVNMAKDYENLKRVEGTSPDTCLIRIYEWINPTVSIGISMDEKDFDLNILKEKKIE